MLICYDAVDAARDGRSDSRLGRVMYRGEMDGVRDGEVAAAALAVNN